MSSEAANILASLKPLVALRISNGALAASPNLPDKLKILNWGENPSVEGPILVGEKSARFLDFNQKTMGFAEVALDFEHNTVPGTPEYERTKEPRPVAAYGVPRIVHGDGLYLENLRWTPDGKASAINYADLSPAIRCDKGSGEVVFVHSTALTRNGAVHELSFHSAQLGNKPKDHNMKDETISVAELAAAFGLKDTSTKAEVLGALKSLSTNATAFSALLKDGKLIVLGAIEDRLKGVEEITKHISAGTGGIVVLSSGLETRLAGIESTIKTLGNEKLTVLSASIEGKEVKITPQDLVSLSVRVQKMEKDILDAAAAAKESEQGKIIALFAQEGKVPLGEDGKAIGPEILKTMPAIALKALLASTPVTVPLSARGKLREGGGGGTNREARLASIREEMASAGSN